MDTIHPKLKEAIVISDPLPKGLHGPERSKQYGIRTDNRHAAQCLCNAIVDSVFEEPADFDGPQLLIQHAARIYLTLPEVYQEAIQKVLKSLESTSTDEHEIKTFGIWQHYLARTMEKNDG